MSFTDSILDYLRSSKSEFEKVSWPTRRDTIRYTALVIGLSAVVAIFFAGLDFALGGLVQGILAKQQAGRQAAPAAATRSAPVIPDLVNTAKPSGQTPDIKVDSVDVKSVPKTTPSAP